MISQREPYRNQSYKLFDDYNSCHIFVEDAGMENLYKEILRRCGLSIRKVFSKNGKGEVLRAAQASNDRRCIFVVDRDWDDLLGNIHSLRNLIVLQKHSIENYLIHYEAFCAIIIGDKPKIQIETLLNCERYQEIVSDICLKLRPLFECFAAMQMCGRKEDSCGRNPGNFQVNNRSCAPDERKISNFITEVSIEIPQQVRNYFAGDVLCDRGHGKYMLHFAWAAIRHISKVSQLSSDKLMMRLAQVVDTEAFEDLHMAITERLTEASD